MRQLRAMARLDRLHVHFNRNTSVIFRMEYLSCDIATSPFGLDDEDSLPQIMGIIQRCFTLYGFRRMPSTDSDLCRPLIPDKAKKWTASSGLSGRHALDLMVDMLRIHWSPSTGLRRNFFSFIRGKHSYIS